MFMARDNYGNTFHDIGPHPRKWLLDYFGRKHAERMYHDTPDGPKHIGYIIAGHWLRLYRVEPYEN